MTQVIANSGHDDMIHDAVLDYYGRRLATCSSDKTIKIFEVEGESHRLVETLKGHEGAVWCVAWAHPKYGTILASSSYDGHVFIWRETSPSSGASNGAASNWTRIIDFALHTASVNLLSWSPHDVGCLLACASSDGLVSVLDFKDTSTWDHALVPAHPGVGCNAVSWGPSILPGQLERAVPPSPSLAGAAAGGVRRFASGGSDCLVKIWEFGGAAGAGQYANVATLSGHTDWVRDVAWSPSVLGKTYVASASQDRSVRIWTNAGAASDEAAWKCTVLNFECVLWRVSWSLSGNVLAVSGGDNKVSLWKERVRDGGWECVKTIEE